MNKLCLKVSFLLGFLSLLSTPAQANNLVGNVDINLSVSQGEPVVSIPLHVPETADGMRPKLSIYSTKGLGNPILGQGFKFSGFSRLHRCQTNMDDDGRISPLTLKENNFCINGKRLKKDSSTGAYHRIKNSYSKFTFNTGAQTWKEEAGDGRIYHYSPIGKSGKQQFEWRVSKIESIAAQNTVNYIYDSSSLVTKPASISYADYLVEFHYDNYENAMLAKSGVHGDFYQDNKRLKSISIKKSGLLFKEYKLGYNSINQQLFLASVQVCYNNSAQCLKPAKIEYEQHKAFEHTWITKPQAFNKAVDRNNPLKSEIRVIGDVNADGLDDNCAIYIEDRALYCTVNGTSSKWLDFSGAFDFSYARDLYTNDFSKKQVQEGFRKARLHLGELSSSSLIDINNDGYADFCFSSNNHLYCAINNKNGFSAYQSMQALTPLSSETPLSSPAKIIWEDFNGDGFTDFCAIESHGKKLDDSVDYQAYINNYRSYYEQTTKVSCYINQRGQTFQKIPMDYIKPVNTLLSLPIILPADMNGDRIKDVCIIELNAKKTVPINKVNQTMTTGSAKSVLSCYSQDGLIGKLDLLKAASSGKSFGDSEAEIKEVNDLSRSVRLVDVSKDGVSDVCFVWKDQPHCIINDGKLTQSSHAMLKSNVSVKPDYGSMSDEMKQIMDSSLTFRDWNSDGEIDACWIDLKGFNCAYGSLGHFKAASRLFEMPLSDKGVFGLKTITVNAGRNWFGRLLYGNKTTAYQADLAGNLAFGPAVKMPDSNGNGFPEFCYQYEGVTKCKDIPYAKTRIKSIQDSLGVKSTVEYTSSLNSSVYRMDQLRAKKIRVNPQKMLVSSLIVDNGLSSNLTPKQQNRFNYRYKNLVFKPNMGLMGFEQITKVDITKNKVTTTEYNMSGYPFYGLTKRNQVHYDGVLKTDSHHQYKKQGSSKFFHVVPEKITRLKHKDNVVEVKTTRYSNYDSHGYAGRVSEEVAYRNNSNTRLVVNKQIRYEHRTSSPYILGLKTQVSTSYGGSAEKNTTTRHSFTHKGLLQETTLSADGKDIKRTNYEGYNLIGKPSAITETDLTNNQTRTQRFTYDQTTGLLTRSENALGHKKALSYDSIQSQICQKPSQITDANNRVTHFQYDSLCRTKSIMNPDSSKVLSQWHWDNGMQRGYKTNKNTNLDISAPSVYKEIQTFYAPNQSQYFNKQVTVYKDKLGRSLRKVLEGDASKGSCSETKGVFRNASILTDYAYDRFGNKAGETRPYYDCIGGSVYNNQVWLVSQYDKQNRLIKYTTHHNEQPIETTYQYQGNKVTKKYQGQEEKVTTYNLFNKPASIRSRKGVVKFSYDVMGNLVQVERNRLTTKMTYDSLGNKLSINDPDRGLWHYQYNGFGELVWQKDANGTVFTMAYDKLGRMLNKTAGGQRWQWQYDAANAKGQIHKEISKQAQTQYSYDALGRLTQKDLAVGSKTYATQYSYNPLNQVIKESHPSGLDILKDYDYLGRPKALYAPKEQINGYAKEVKQAIEQAIKIQESTLERLSSIISNNSKILKNLIDKKESAENLLRGLNLHVGSREKKTKKLEKRISSLDSLINKHVNDMQEAEVAMQKMIKKGLNRFLEVVKNANNEKSLSGNVIVKRTNLASGIEALKNSYVYTTKTRRKKKAVCSSGVVLPATFLTGEACVAGRWYRPNEHYHVINPVKYYARVYQHYCDKYKEIMNQRNAQADALNDQLHGKGRAAKVKNKSCSDLVKLHAGAKLVAVTPDGFLIFVKDHSKKHYTSSYTYSSGSGAQSNSSSNEYKSLYELKEKIRQAAKKLSEAEQRYRQFSLTAKSVKDQFEATKTAIAALQGARGELNKPAGVQGRALIWQATHYQANGMLHSELFGNGYSTERKFDAYSNRITQITTAFGGKGVNGSNNNNILRDLHYAYDQRGNVIEQKDTQSNTVQSYQYGVGTHQHPDHLTGWTYSNSTNNINITESYTYDLAGNMSPEGVTAQFDINNSHRILSANIQNRAGRTNETYQYDNNGNMIQRGSTSITYDALTGKVASINGNQQTFSYHVNGQRLNTETQEAGIRTSVLSVNPTLNKVTKGTDTLWRHSLRIGGEVVSVIEKVGHAKDKKKADKVAFIHRDLQGNPDRVTGLSGQEIRQYMRSNNQATASLGAEQVIRNPYGRVVKASFVKKETQKQAKADTYRSVFESKSRNVKASDHEKVKQAINTSISKRLTYQDMIAFGLPGYTGHKELPSVDLINMNARLYDPVLGRFISADSIVPDTTNWDDYNRYMYVRGNPMKYTDPSGHSPESKDDECSIPTGDDDGDCYDTSSSSRSGNDDDDDDRGNDREPKVEQEPTTPVGGNEAKENRQKAEEEEEKKKRHYNQNGEVPVEKKRSFWDKLDDLWSDFERSTKENISIVFEAQAAFGSGGKLGGSVKGDGGTSVTVASSKGYGIDVSVRIKGDKIIGSDNSVDGSYMAVSVSAGAPVSFSFTLAIDKDKDWSLSSEVGSGASLFIGTELGYIHSN